MLSKAWECIKLNRMIEMGDRIVIGVSGGADSVCLLYLLIQYCKEYEVTLIAVHVNHGIRGEEAARDEQFVREFCERQGVEFLNFSFDVPEIAKQLKLSEEEAGRNCRYEAFLEVCETKKCNKIAIAHNRNDNAETVLFHLFRGAGLRGLSGMEPVRKVTASFGEVSIIRPLITTGRDEIEEYLRLEKLVWQTDSTNLTEDYTRNKIRSRILAYTVKEINSGAIVNIADAANHLRESSDYIENEIMKSYMELVTERDDAFRVPVKELVIKHPVLQKGILLKLIESLAHKRRNLENKHVEAVLSLLDKQVGREVHLPYGIVAEREYETIKLYCIDTERQPSKDLLSVSSIAMQIPGKTFLVQRHIFFEAQLIDYKNNIMFPKNSCVKWFDYDKIENAVEIRTRREGDYLQINSSGGSKKLKDYFIDHKVPRELRDSQLLVTEGSHVMWIIGEGERISERYKVSDTTRRILVIKKFDLEEDADDR